MRSRWTTWRMTGCLVALLLAVMPRFSAADQSGDFDLYLLSLSWSPEYCATHKGDTAQCGTGKHFGLVTHGLWPQYATSRIDPVSGQQSGWPANCPSSANPAPPEEAIALWPSPDLYRHEWQKHGTCTGLDPEAYVALTKTLRQRFQIPAILMPQARNQSVTAEGLRDAIAAANPGLAPEDLTLVCHRAWLTEIRLCLARGGSHDYLTCPATVSNDTPCPDTIRIQGLGN